MNTKYISLRRWKIHEFHRTLRIAQQEDPELRAQSSLQLRIFEKATKLLGKYATRLFIAYLIVNTLSDGSLVSLKVFDLELSVPLAYFLAATSFLFLNTMIALNNFIVAALIHMSSGGLSRSQGQNIEMRELLDVENHHENAELGMPTFHSRVLKDRLHVSEFLSLTVLAVCISALVPVFVYGFYLYTQLAGIWSNADISFLENLAGAFGVVVLGVSFLQFAFYHLPMPFVKDPASIRWRFLVNLYPVGKHPQIFTWLAQEENKRK